MMLWPVQTHKRFAPRMQTPLPPGAGRPLRRCLDVLAVSAAIRVFGMLPLDPAFPLKHDSSLQWRPDRTGPRRHIPCRVRHRSTWLAFCCEADRCGFLICCMTIRPSD